MVWLIEKGLEGALEAAYFGMVGHKYGWTRDTNKAVRFVSKEEADSVSADPLRSKLPPLLDPHMSVEHLFDGE